jgi:hypothetical protein
VSFEDRKRAVGVGPRQASSPVIVEQL